MKKKLKVLIPIFLVVFILLSGLFSVYFSYLHRYKGKKVEYIWTKDDEFSVSKIATVEKQSGKDFIILNLADIQLADIEDFNHRKIIRDEIDYLVKTVKPDLITLTGDQTWSNENLISTKLIIKWLDGYKIPYAPVFGNHDYGNEYNSAVASREYLCDLYENSKYCLFSRGPTNLNSLGNYVINIMEEGKVFKTIYMLDAGYNDVITTEQIDWIKWNADGIKGSGEYIESMMFMHKPIPEYEDAYYQYYMGNIQSIGPVYDYCSNSGTSQNGLFDLAKVINVKNIVCGHQHTNCYTLPYDGINLTFALKTGELSFYYDDGEVNLNGGTKFILNNLGTTIENVCVDNSFHIEGSDNICA